MVKVRIDLLRDDGLAAAPAEPAPVRAADEVEAPEALKKRGDAAFRRGETAAAARLWTRAAAAARVQSRAAAAVSPRRKAASPRFLRASGASTSSAALTGAGSAGAAARPSSLRRSMRTLTIVAGWAAYAIDAS